MVVTPVGPQFLVGSLKDQFLDPCSFYYMLMIFHLLWTIQFHYSLMMPRSINQLDVKLITCNSNVILLHCIDGQKLGYLILILVSVTYCI